MDARRSLNRPLLGVAVVAAMVLSTAPVAASAARPVRSGMIVTGAAEEWDVEDPDACRAVPDCAAWLLGGCRPELARRNPAVAASIEDVRQLRGSRRVFHYDRSAAGIAWGVVVIQFWRGDCTEVPRAQHRLLGGGGPPRALRVPATARWMTVTSSYDSVNIVWTLT